MIGAAWPHVRGALFALAVFAILCTGTPGFDLLGKSKNPDPRTPAALVPLARVAIALNQNVRRPLEHLFVPIERAFRISQSWHLYQNGPNHVARIEVWADDRLLYRSLDRDYAFLEPVLRNRRVRPMADAVATAKGGHNWRGFTSYLTREIRDRWPATQRVEVRVVWSPWPGDKPKLHHQYVAAAPEWLPKRETP